MLVRHVVRQPEDKAAAAGEGTANEFLKTTPA